MSTEQNQRARRSVPERTGPIRSAASFERPSPPRPPEKQAPAPGSPDGVERAVDNAYRVLDEQLMRGEELARSYRGLFDRGGGAYGDLTSLPRSMFRLWRDVLGMWLDVLGPLAPPGIRAALRGDAAQPDAVPEPASPPQPAWTRVTLDVSSARAVEIDLELPRDAVITELMVQDLSAFDGGGKPPITGVKLEPGRDGRVVLRLAVLPDQPAGIYLGMILDRARAEQRGTLRVVVRP